MTAVSSYNNHSLCSASRRSNERENQVLAFCISKKEYGCKCT